MFSLGSKKYSNFKHTSVLFTLRLLPRYFKMDVARVARFKILKNRYKLFNCLLRGNHFVTVKGAKAGNNGFIEDFDKCHLETSNFQKTLLGIGSAVVSLADPRRGDMIAALGETTGTSALKHVYSKMEQSEEGKRILNEKPRINSSSVDLEKLRGMKEGTVGKNYVDFLDRYVSWFINRNSNLTLFLGLFA